MLHEKGPENWFLTKIVIKAVSIYRVFLWKKKSLHLHTWSHAFQNETDKVEVYPKRTHKCHHTNKLIVANRDDWLRLLIWWWSDVAFLPHHCILGVWRPRLCQRACQQSSVASVQSISMDLGALNTWILNNESH